MHQNFEYVPTGDLFGSQLEHVLVQITKNGFLAGYDQQILDGCLVLRWHE